MSVRSRVVELSANPELLEQPIGQFTDPGAAKLEADAHIAICIDEFVERQVTSEPYRRTFVGDFCKKITDRYHPDTPNSQIGADAAIESFEETFEETYLSIAAIGNVVRGTPAGKRAVELGTVYAGLCEAYIAQTRSESIPLFVNHHRYTDPIWLIRLGMATFKAELTRLLWTVDASGLPTEQKEVLLQGASARPLLKLGSLSIAQLRLFSELRSPVSISDEGVDVASDIQAARRLPLYESSMHETLRPRHMCLAMPDLPKNELLHGGSSLAKLWHLGAGLIVATNMHARKDDRPEYKIAGYEPYHRYVAAAQAED